MAEESIGSSCKEDEDTLEIDERCWSELPRDPLSVILQHLFLGHRHIFNAVCKSWNPVDTLRLPLPPPIHSPYFDSPCLMFSDERKDDAVLWKLFHSLYNDSYSLDFPELFGAEIRYSKYGWLLMSQGENAYFFFNPSTKVKLDLPLINDSFLQVCFTSPPISGDCIIFGILSNSTIRDTEFGIIKFGEKEWAMYEYSNTYKFKSTNCSPVFCNGLFYCLDQWGNLGVFNPLNEKCRWVQYNKCHRKRLSYNDIHESYMAVVDGEIWGVFVMHDDRRVGAYKLDFEKFVWDPLQNLENKCLFISPTTSIAESCVDKSLANKIYFNKFYDGNGVVYSLADKMYHSVGGNFASKGAYRMREVNHCTWFKHARSELNTNVVE